MEVGEHLNIVAQTQGTELPMHMIREFFRLSEGNWNEQSAFDIKSDKPPMVGESQEGIRNKLMNRQFMMRGMEMAELSNIDPLLEVYRGLPPLYASILEQDYKVFKQLFDKRKEQFDSQFERAQHLPQCIAVQLI